ncbi:MAG TPA: alpha/beta hydrolase [Xanthobacteraceae bacterium]|nr:alpha/beta hydrolase [Xanthobacteraceae bacterium]
MNAMACSEAEQTAHFAGSGVLDRRALLEGAGVIASALGMGATLGAAAPAPGSAFDPKAEANRIAFDRTGKGDDVLLISGFPQTRRSWNRVVPLLSKDFRTVAADLPSFGDSGLLPVPATTENAGRIFHEFVRGLGTPLHVVAHDFGAWVAYSWVLLFPEDFKSLTLIDAGIPGVTLTEDVQLSDYKRKWIFIFQMLPDLPVEFTKGKEDVYVGWWFKNKVYKPGAIAAEDAAAYARAYAGEGRMDAAFDYCRQIIVDMEFNKRQFKAKSPVRLLAVGGEHSIPNMGEALKPYFENITSLVVADSGHFVPEEQPAVLASALTAFLRGESLQ